VEYGSIRGIRIGSAVERRVGTEIRNFNGVERAEGKMGTLEEGEASDQMREKYDVSRVEL
jgi:hypothetical protein